MGGDQGGSKGYEKIELPKEEPAPPSRAYLDKNGNFLITQDGMDLVTHFEGYYEKAYRDPVGVVTIGWGTIKYPNGKKVQMGDTCTKEQAAEWLRYDLYDDGAKYVRSFLIDSIEEKLTPAQFSTLVSLTYNRGAGRFRDYVAKHLNENDFKKALLGIKSLNWAVSNGEKKYLLGLDRRRWAEAEMFNGGDWRKFDTIAKFQAFKNRGYR